MTVDESRLPQPGEPSRRGFSRLLWRLADLVQAAERRRSFRARAFRRAIWSLDDLPPDLAVPEEQLLATAGIGPGVAALVREYRSTGGLDQLVPLEQAFPEESTRLRRLPRMTPAMLRDLKTGLDVDTTSDLIAAIESGAAETLKGAGPQTLALWQEVLELPPRPGSIPAHEAWVLATALRAHLARHLAGQVEVAGQVRRVVEWVDVLDLVAVAGDRSVLEEFVATTAVLSGDLEVTDDVLRAESLDGVPVSVHHALPGEAGTKLLWATGPADHAAAITSDPFPTEEDAYRSSGLAVIPAPARELPVETASGVVDLADLKGDLHLHTDLSPDGRMSLETILTEAGARGYEYVLITDHTEGLRFGGLGIEEIAAQVDLIDGLRGRFPGIRVFHGAELNIGVEGLLDLPEAALEMLDFAVAGVHSHFKMDRTHQTARVLTALAHPVVRVLAHPFGRRIGIRPRLDLDMERVIDAAVEHGVALETNGHRDRLDLPAEWIRTAASRGALFAANSDAHRVDEIGNAGNAVATLQRAGIPATGVVNTWPLGDMETWVSRGRHAGAPG